MNISGSEINTSGKSKTAAGYRDIESYKDRFIAVGANGRIDIINNRGEVTDNLIPVNKDDLNCAIADNQILIAAGDNGTSSFLLTDGTFQKLNQVLKPISILSVA